MSCVIAGDAIVCGVGYPSGRLHVGNRYIWVEIHPYCGPAFWWDSAMSRDYIPKDEDDPVWKPFEKWLKNRNSK